MCFILFNAMDWHPDNEVLDARLKSEIAAAERAVMLGGYKFVRVVRDRRRCRAFIYVI